MIEDILTSLLNDALFDLYLILAVTYIGATIAVLYRHSLLWVCYLILAAVYIAIAMVHNGAGPDLAHPGRGVCASGLGR